MSLTRSTRTQLAFAILFIVLGVGNIVFGTYRARDYRRALFQATQVVSPKAEAASEEKILPEALSREPLSGAPSTYLTQIRARYDFYLFVTVGGKWMLALAGFFLLLSLVGMADRAYHEETPEEDDRKRPN